MYTFLASFCSELKLYSVGGWRRQIRSEIYYIYIYIINIVFIVSINIQKKTASLMRNVVSSRISSHFEAAISELLANLEGMFPCYQ